MGMLLWFGEAGRPGQSHLTMFLWAAATTLCLRLLSVRRGWTSCCYSPFSSDVLWDSERLPDSEHAGCHRCLEPRQQTLCQEEQGSKGVFPIQF